MHAEPNKKEKKNLVGCCVGRLCQQYKCSAPRHHTRGGIHPTTRVTVSWDLWILSESKPNLASMYSITIVVAIRPSSNWK